MAKTLSVTGNKNKYVRQIRFDAEYNINCTFETDCVVIDGR